MEVRCAHCGTMCDKDQSAINRASKIGAPLFCNKTCFGLAHRNPNPPTEAERKAAKSAYDARRRAEKREEIKSQKREYHKRTYDPDKAREVRKGNMPRHVEYCRRPEYRAKKHDYDIQRAAAEYGEFAEAWRLLIDLEKEIRRQAPWYDRAVANGYFTRNAQKRRRELCQAMRANRRI